MLEVLLVPFHSNLRGQRIQPAQKQGYLPRIVVRHIGGIAAHPGVTDSIFCYPKDLPIRESWRFEAELWNAGIKVRRAPCASLVRCAVTPVARLMEHFHS